MKTITKNAKKLSAILLLLVLTSTLFASCKKEETNLDALWNDAVYTEDTEVGEGSKTVAVTVKAGESQIVITINTDADTLGEALLDNKIVEGEDSEYGLYIKKVNGIRADYDVDKAYWGFYKGGELMMSGVDSTTISGGEAFELVYEK